MLITVEGSLFVQDSRQSEIYTSEVVTLDLVWTASLPCIDKPNRGTVFRRGVDRSVPLAMQMWAP